MTEVKTTALKNDFKNICDHVSQGEVYIVTRPKEENIVMLSASKYAELERIKNNTEYIAKIDRAIAQKECGTMQEHDLITI